MAQTLTTGPRTYRLTLEHRLKAESQSAPSAYHLRDVQKTITARSITAAIALLYEQHPEYSSAYRVVGVEEVPADWKDEVYQSIVPIAEKFASLPRIPDSVAFWQHAGSFFKPRTDTVTINGAKIIGPALIDILNMVTQPNPRRWYRFERQGENIIVQTKQDEDSK
jgi:hypothetical protein